MIQLFSKIVKFILQQEVFLCRILLHLRQRLKSSWLCANGLMPTLQKQQGAAKGLLISTLVTDGDMALQMELADDDISDVRKAVKTILRDGTVSGEEAVQLKQNAKNLRETAK